MLVLLLGATYFVMSNFELFQPASNKQLERELEKAGVKAPDNSKRNDK
jgi:hypothetical protein